MLLLPWTPCIMVLELDLTTSVNASHASPMQLTCHASEEEVGSQQCTMQALCAPTGSSHPQLSHLIHSVVNINVPAQDPFQGFYLAHQGSGIVDLKFQQVSPDTPDEREGHMLETVGNEQGAKRPKDTNQKGGMRTFRNLAGAVRW